MGDNGDVTEEPTVASTAVEPARDRYRLALSPLSRWVRVAVLALSAAFFVALALSSGQDVSWRALGGVGLVSTAVALRIVLGPAVVVRSSGLRVVRSWPLRRDIPWYRILDVEVVPVVWVLDVELNSGEHVELPPVEHLNELYHRIESLRHELDA